MLIFPPSQGQLADSNWHVTAKSPSVDKPPSRGKKDFTQEDLEGRMKKDLSTAFDLAGESNENVPPAVNMSRHRVKAKAKANYKTSSSSAAITAEDDTLEEIVVQHPLKKKTKKIQAVKKPATRTDTRRNRSRNESH